MALLLTVTHAAGQGGKNLRLHTIDNNDRKVSTYNLPGSVADDAQARTILRSLVLAMTSDGYLEASLDSLTSDSVSVTAYVHTGPRYYWTRLSKGNIPPDLLDQIKFPKDSLEGRNVLPPEYARLSEKILKYYENNGYPFAELRIIHLQLADSGLYGELQLSKNMLFEMDTIDLRGNAEVNKSFLYNYLGFKPGDLYDERIISSIDRKLNQLPYIKKLYNSKVYFIGTKARVVIYADKRKTDRLDGVVGLAPNSNSTKRDLLLTGEVNVDLRNLAGSGMALGMHWKSFLENSSELHLAFKYPYLFQTPVGTDLEAELQRFDTITTNVSYTIGSQFMFRGSNHVRVFYRNNFSILQSVDTSLIRSSRSIPWSNPVDIKSYGIDLFLEKLDYKINPRQGFSAGIVIAISKKNIRRDNRIEAVLFTDQNGHEYSVYDSAKLEHLQGSVLYRFQYFLPAFRKSAFVATVSGRHLLASQIFFNELYRIGGNNLLRGYDENSILASSYTVTMLEFRYLLSQNSHFNLFVNSAYYEDRNVETDRLVSGFPLGFGAGINLETRTGILTIAYALGTDPNYRVDLSRAKIHFGIISYI